MRLPTSLSLLFMLIFLLNQGVKAQDTLRVPSTYSTIQFALDVAIENSVILVSPGVYYENLVWPGNIDGIALVSEKGSLETIIDGGGVGRVILGGLTNLSIKGFTIQNGYVYVEEEANGGAINFFDVEFIFKDLVIKSNSAEGNQVYGGAVFLNNSIGYLENCQFLNNEISAIHMGRGGGLFAIGQTSNLVFDDCSFIDNKNNVRDNSGLGGAICVFGESGICELSHCDFSGNSIRLGTDYSGDIIGGAGGAFVSCEKTQITNCTFSKNEVWADYASGGALYTVGDSIIIDSVKFDQNKVVGTKRSYGGAIHLLNNNFDISNSDFIKNGSGFGSGIGLQQFLYATNVYFGNISSCVFKDNFQSDSPSMNVSTIYIQTGFDFLKLDISNCIMTKNEGSPFYLGGYQEVNLEITHSTICKNGSQVFGGYSNEKSITNSIIWQNGLEDTDLLGGTSINNLVDIDPQFVDEIDWIPSLDSPVLNAGTLMTDVNFDILGNPRPLPVGSHPDIGAYELDQEWSSIFSIENDLQISIFPNPSSDEIQFDQRVENISLYNQEGKVVKTSNNASRLNLQGIPTGNYFLKLELNGERAVQKVMVNQ